MKKSTTLATALPSTPAETLTALERQVKHLHPVLVKYLRTVKEFQPEISAQLVYLKVGQLVGFSGDFPSKETVRQAGINRGLKPMSIEEVCALALNLHDQTPSYRLTPMMEEFSGELTGNDLCLDQKTPLLSNLVISNFGIGASGGYMGGSCMEDDDMVVFKM
jgi:hypothetical protein